MVSPPMAPVTTNIPNPPPQLPRNSADVFQGVLQIDPWLSPFQDVLKRRYSKAKEWISKIDETEGGLLKFTKVCCFLSQIASLDAPPR